jgi:hypothetical protein
MDIHSEKLEIIKMRLQPMIAVIVALRIFLNYIKAVWNELSPERKKW